MHSLMLAECGATAKRLIAELTVVWLLAGMDPLMTLKIRACDKALITLIALEWLLAWWVKKKVLGRRLRGGVHKYLHLYMYMYVCMYRYICVYV